MILFSAVPVTALAQTQETPGASAEQEDQISEVSIERTRCYCDRQAREFDLPLPKQYFLKAELLHDGKDAEGARKIWLRLSEMECQARDRFPLSDADCVDLRAQLQARIMQLY
ncbi:MAG: hypothetical protein L0220_00405, partial [Acidobacteria bacterium]|nr:hypothetical protein [Acidobacteriota bacterium]